MTNEIKEILFETIGDIFEKMAFMFSEFAEEDEVDDDLEALQAQMSYSGDTGSGVIWLAVDKDMAGELAENLLGYSSETEEEGKQVAVDALKELLNVVCGSFITTVHGEELVFDLSVPEISRISPKQWKKLKNNSDNLIVLVDDSAAIAHVEVK
jgi:chemotaxis protein CheY-P-specific phosphatase CheC